MGKNEEIKILRKTTDYFTMVVAAAVPIILIGDALFNQLWKQLLIVIVVSLSTTALVMLTSGEAQLFLHLISYGSLSFYYYSQKSQFLIRKFVSIDWSIKATSNEKKRSKAIDEWILSKALVPK